MYEFVEFGVAVDEPAREAWPATSEATTSIYELELSDLEVV